MKTAFAPKFLQLLLLPLFVFMLNVGWGQVAIIPKLFLTAQNTPSGNTGWTITNAPINNAGTDYWKMINTNAVLESPAMNLDTYAGETCVLKLGTFGTVSSAKQTITVTISTNNGSTWAALTTRTPTSSGSTSMTAIDLSSYVGTQVKLRFANLGGDANTGVRFFEAYITGTIAPTITGTTTATAFTTTYGTASAAQSFSVSGSNLTANLVATAPTGFEVSADGTTYGSTATFTQTSGSASGTLRLRLKANAAVLGTFNSQNIVLSSTGATSVNITTAASGNSVTAKALTITSASVTNKIYDRTTAATVTGSLSGVVNSDVVTLSGTGTFAQSDIGTGISVTSTATLGGAGSGNYTLTQPTGLTANITAKALTVSSALAGNKTYDGTNTATVSGGSLVGVISPDVVTINQTGTFAQTIVGTGILVTSTSTIGGANSGNYTLTQPTGLTANITAKSLTISGITASDKIYDGTNTATVSGGSLVGVISPDDVTLSQTGTFAQSNAGTGISVTSSSTIGGSNSGNYSLTQPTGLTASITKASPEINSSPAATDIVLGQALSASTLSGGSATPSNGVFTFTSPSTIPGSIGVYSADIIYTPSDVTNYNTVSGTANVNVNDATTPTLTAVALTNNLTSSYGTPSSGVSFSADGLSLVGNITVTAQSGYEVSAELASGYAASVSVAGGSTVYVRFSGTKSVGNYNNDVFAVLTSSGASSVNAITSSAANAISPKALTISSASIASKTYDASSTTGTVTLGTLSGLVGSETIVVSSAIGTFADDNVETEKTATITYVLSDGTNGGLAANYSLASTTSTGSITAKALSISAASIASKTYNASSATGIITPGTLSGLVGTETVVVSSATGSYSDANVGTGKTAVITYVLGNGTNGGFAANYSLANTSASGNITTKALSISAASILSKTYDASSASGTVTAGTLSGLIGSETVVVSNATGVFSDANAETGKTATITYVLSDGTNGGLALNYSLSNTTSIGNITAKALSISAATIAPKEYNASSASGFVTPGTLSEFVGIETVVVSSATGVYSDPNAESGKLATIIYVLGNGTNGGLATNYSLANSNATGDITQATQTISFSSFTTPITAGTTIAATSNVGGTIVYSSSNTAVATINSSTGVVTTVGNGTTTITASNAGNLNYTAASVSQVLTVNSSSVVTLLTWNTFGNAGTETTEPSTSNSNVSNSTLTLGSISAAGNSNRFGGSGWFKSGNTNPSILSEAITGNSYIEFIVTPNIGYSITPTSFEFIWDFSGTGPSSVALRSSADNYSTNLGSLTGMTTSTSAVKTISISGLSNISSATTFRLYGYGGTATTGTGGFDCASNQNNVLLKGTISCITPSQSSSITGSSTVCSGTSQTYSVTNVAGVGYNWSLPSGWLGTSTTNSITSIAGSTGTVAVTPYNSASGCTNYTATSQSVSVTVNPAPTVPTAGNASRCGAGTATISATPGAGETIDWYSAATGGTLLLSGNSSYTTAGISSTTIYYAEARNTTTGCVSSTRTAVTATVNTLPTVNTTANQAVCAGTSVTLSGSGASTYSWSTSSTAASITVTPASTTTYTVTGTDSNGCTATTTSTVTVNALPTVVTLTAPAYCSNTTGTISTATSQTNVTYDLWTSGEAIPNTSTTGTGNALSWTLLSAGDYFVVATNANNCTATSATITLASFNQYSYYPDTDGDGFGAGTVSLSCNATTPSGFSTLSTDCNDNNAAVSPGTAEVCGDGIDNNCDNSETYPIMYRSAVASGDWSNASTWEKSCNSGTWDAALIAPSNQYFNVGNPFAVTIQSGHTVTVSTTSTTAFAKAGSLSVAGNLIVNGNLTVTSSVINSGNVTINHGASFVQTSENTTNSGSGNFIVNMNLTGTNNGTAPNGRYWYLGSPMNNTVASLFFDQPKMVRLWIYEPSNNSWVTLINSSTTASGATSTTQLIPGIGYLYRAGADKTITFTGDATKFNNNITTPLSFTGTGYKYVANPYTSHIDWRQVTRTGLNVSYWIRNTTNTAYEAYNATSGVSTPSGTQTTQFIPPMQGFWIYAFTTPCSLRMDNGDRVHSTNGLHAPEHNQIVRLNLNNGKTDDQAVVYENENASNGIEEYDTDKFMDENHHQVYFLEGTKQLTLDGLKDATAKQKVDMGIQITAAGTYTINAVELGVEEDVMLEDKFTHTFQDMKRNNTYSFTSNAGNYNNRFVLHFTLNPQTETAMETVEVGETVGEIEGVNVYTTTGQQVKVWVTNTNDFQNATVKVYDAIGNMIERKNMTSNELLLDIDTATGVYLVEVTGANKTFTKKVFIGK